MNLHTWVHFKLYSMSLKVLNLLVLEVPLYQASVVQLDFVFGYEFESRLK